MQHHYSAARWLAQCSEAYWWGPCRQGCLPWHSYPRQPSRRWRPALTPQTVLLPISCSSTGRPHLPSFIINSLAWSVHAMLAQPRHCVRQSSLWDVMSEGWTPIQWQWLIGPGHLVRHTQDATTCTAQIADRVSRALSHRGCRDWLWCSERVKMALTQLATPSADYALFLSAVMRIVSGFIALRATSAPHTLDLALEKVCFLLQAQ